MVAGGTPARRACSRIDSSATSSGRSSTQRAAVCSCGDSAANASTIGWVSGPVILAGPSSFASPPHGGEESDDSADRQCVHLAALAPQRIDAALELQCRALTDVALVDVAVVPDLLDDVVEPLLAQPQRLAVARIDAQQCAQRRVGQLAPQRIDVLRADRALLGLDHRVV